MCFPNSDRKATSANSALWSPMPRLCPWLPALVALCLLCCSGEVARGNVVLDWNAAVLDAIRAESTSPPLASRNLALLHTALFDTVNSILRTHQPYRVELDAPPEANVEHAACAAGFEVAGALFPSFRARFESLLLSQTGSASLTQPPDPSLEFGRRVALQILEARAADGSSTDIPYIPSESPGQWRRTAPFFRPPLAPQWRYVTPFCLPDVEMIALIPPPALDSAEYAKALAEVQALGGSASTLRTAEQSEIARFWSDFSYTATPPGHWLEIAADIARDAHTPLPETARLFALLSLAQADAAIFCWEAKYRHNLWRPITAIQRADEDGNPATVGDPNWNHFLAAPPFPSYTSGHSTFSAASSRVLARFLGGDSLHFSARSDSLPGVVRTFSSLAACADEIGMSRVYGGIHFQFDNVEGKRTGALIGDYVSACFLLPLDSLPRLELLEASPDWTLLRVHGRRGHECVVESSTDLLRWIAIGTNTAMTGGFHLGDPARKAAARFYRVLER